MSWQAMIGGQATRRAIAVRMNLILMGPGLLWEGPGALFAVIEGAHLQRSRLSFLGLWL